MCLCVCCGSSKYCTFLAAIYSGIESVLFFTLNLVLMFGYECIIEPPQKEHLTPGFEFIEQVWSWFFYDEENCIDRYGRQYTEPEWIVEIPPGLSKLTKLTEEVSPKANYAYQVTFLILHLSWFFASVILLYGNARKRWLLFMPWIFIALAITGLDTIIGAFYIKLMSDTDPGWDDGRAVFSMQFLYFRGFLLYICNILALSIVFITFWKTYNKRKKEERLKAAQNTTIEIPITVITPEKHSEAGPSNQYEQGTEIHETYLRNEAPEELDHLGHSFQDPPRKKPVPSKYRPFSYINPAYRPTDPHDIEGMKNNAPVIRSSSFEQRTLDQMRNYDSKLPRVSIRQQKRYED